MSLDLGAAKLVEDHIASCMGLYGDDGIRALPHGIVALSLAYHTQAEPARSTYLA